MSKKVFAVHSAWIRGVEALPVTVEVSMSDALTNFSVLGLGSTDERESIMRIRCSLAARGYEMPRKNITVNLSPGGMRKSGTSFDLAIAVAILAASAQIPVKGLDKALFVGELNLYGDCHATKGDVAFQLLARDRGLKLVTGTSERPIVMSGIERLYVKDVSDLRWGMDMQRNSENLCVPEAELGDGPDYSEVYGQEVAKRGLALAAAGELGLLMVGSPGSGKSMLAERMTTILPPLDPAVQQEALCVHSVVGEPVEGIVAGKRPFRSPHHSISKAGLVGGGQPVRPGEVSLAHGGVLFLDELAEFPTTVLQALRQPIEQGRVRIVRADGSYLFPCRFQLLAASNPCPCGNLGDKEIPCKCSAIAIENYQARLRGPLADRIDIMIDVHRPKAETLINGEAGLSSAQMRELVETGRGFAAWRREKHLNTPPSPDDEELESVISAFSFKNDAKNCLISLANQNHLTGRGINRVCRIARTIADTQEQEKINVDHVYEASMFRGRRDL